MVNIPKSFRTKTYEHVTTIKSYQINFFVCFLSKRKSFTGSVTRVTNFDSNYSTEMSLHENGVHVYFFISF